MYTPKYIWLIFIFTFKSLVNGDENIKQCSEFFHFLDNKLVLIQNFNFIENINAANSTFSIEVGYHLEKKRKVSSIMELHDCKENHPNDWTTCKFDIPLEYYVNIWTVHDKDNNLICGEVHNRIFRRSPQEEITCGDSGFIPNITSLMAGGQDFKPGSWPWMAALYNNLQFICGGSIVSEKVIVTAAHCIQDKFTNEPIQPEESNFVVGKHNLKSKYEKGFQITSIAKFVIHPNWKPHRQNYDADIAVAVLQVPLQYRHNIKPICLHPPKEDSTDLVGLYGVIAGWGYTEEKNLITGIPRIVEIPIVSEDSCIESDSLLGYVMTQRTFCTAGNQGKGPCKGDSGSGLAIRQESKWLLRGIVSATLSQSCDGESHVVFTDVGHFTNWITDFITETSSKTQKLALIPSTDTMISTTQSPTTIQSQTTAQLEITTESGFTKYLGDIKDQATEFISDTIGKVIDKRLKKWFG